MAAPMSTVKSCVLSPVRWFCGSSRLNAKVLKSSRKKGSSTQWLTRQINDPYVKRAREEGWRCRRTWSQQRSPGKVIGVDLQDIEPIDGAILLGHSDFTQTETQKKIQELLNGRLANVVLSDMAPSASSNNQLDHDVICELCLSVLKFSSQVLTSGGHVVCKLWDGRDTDKMLAVMRRMFESVRIMKPESSRSESAEMFLVGLDFQLR